jgi:GntR family transcriptional regulator
MLSAVSERLHAEAGPLSRRLKAALAQAIRDGSLPPNRALPSERDMADALSVSRSTLRTCLKDLAREGLVETRHGSGTVVVGQIPKALSRHSGFSEDARARGLVPTSDILSLSIHPAGADTALRTGMPLGSDVLTLIRLRRANGEALSYESVTVPVWAVGADFDGQGSLYDRMNAFGSRPRRMLQTLEAVAAPIEIGSLLGIEAGAPVLRIAQVGYTADGRPVEDATSWYRGDRYTYVGELAG